MSDSARDPLRNWLRDVLNSLLIGASVRILPSGECRPLQIPWPGPRGDRLTTWRQIESELYRQPGECDVSILPNGYARERAFNVPWPARHHEAAEVQEASLAPLPPRAQVLTDLEQQISSLADRPAKASERCARDVICLLVHCQRRQTTTQLTTALSPSLGLTGWSRSTIEATCAWLVRSGQLDNDRDDRGIGYGLKNWNMPAPDEG